MKTLLSLVFCLFIFAHGNAQEETISSEKGEWILTNYMGFSTLEVENAFKTNTFVYGGFLGKEFRISESYYIISGIEHLRLKSDVSVLGETAYLSHNFIQVPVKIRTVLHKDNASFYGEIGLYASHLYLARTEIISQDINAKDTGLGFNFGITAGFGMKYQITNRHSVNFGINTQSDLFQSYKNNPEVTLGEVFLLQFGLGIRI
jgi:hypothetical protein